jgi:DNA-binding NarL/FixJ family response regulator
MAATQAEFMAAPHPRVVFVVLETSDGSLTDVEAAVARAWRGEAMPEGASALTVRECEVAALLMQGMSNKEIAADLYIEVATVKNHVHHILEKLHVRRRGEVVARLAFGRG